MTTPLAPPLPLFILSLAPLVPRCQYWGTHPLSLSPLRVVWFPLFPLRWCSTYGPRHSSLPSSLAPRPPDGPPWTCSCSGARPATPISRSGQNLSAWRWYGTWSGTTWDGSAPTMADQCWSLIPDGPGGGWRVRACSSWRYQPMVRYGCYIQCGGKFLMNVRSPYLDKSVREGRFSFDQFCYTFWWRPSLRLEDWLSYNFPLSHPLPSLMQYILIWILST